MNDAANIQVVLGERPIRPCSPRQPCRTERPFPEEKVNSHDAYLDFVRSRMLIEDKLVTFLFEFIQFFFLDFQLTHAYLGMKEEEVNAF